MGEMESEVLFLEHNEKLGGRLVGTFNLQVKRKKANTQNI